MSNYPEVRNNTDVVPPLQILLAESDPSEIARIRSNIEREFQDGIKIASNYDELLVKIVEGQPQLLILGRIDKSNYFDICHECHKISESLQIVLISRQKVIDDSFRQLAKAWGVTDIITNDPFILNRLFQTLVKLTYQQPRDLLSPAPILQQPSSERPVKPTFAGAMMLAGLREISTTSNNYFGTLAQGNYWRKSHTRLVDEFPFLLNWSADHFGKLGCNETILDRELTEEDIQSLRLWVRFFIEECERIIIDFGGILNNSDLSPAAKYLFANY
jgi:hypothetical protein